MNSKLKMVFMLVALMGLVLAAGLAFGGCATGPQQIHGSVAVNRVTPIISGPAHGHLAEESEKPVALFFVRGDNCMNPDGVTADLEFVSHIKFEVPVGYTLCAAPLDEHQRVLFHAERP